MLLGELPRLSVTIFRSKWRSQQKLHERKLSRLSQIDEQYYITVSYLLEIAAHGKEIFKYASSNEKRELIGFARLEPLTRR